MFARHRLLAAALLLGALHPANLSAQSGRAGGGDAAGGGGGRAQWDVTLARGKTRDIDFTTNEGTWTSVDISPDGQWVAFDLLGHIYRMPVSGGEATVLTQNSGVALNFHPRISPDGKTIAFITDRRGQYNLWGMNADGSNVRRVTNHPERDDFPCWHPSGQHIIFIGERKGRFGVFQAEIPK